MKREPQRGRRRRGGFSLLEVILALGLFVLAAVSLASALNQIALASAESVDEARVTEQLRSLLTEVTRQPRIEAMDLTLVPDARGISYRVLVEPAEFTSVKGEKLRGLYRVKVTAFRARRGLGGSPEVVEEAETLRYGPMGQGNS